MAEHASELGVVAARMAVAGVGLAQRTQEDARAAQLRNGQRRLVGSWLRPRRVAHAVAGQAVRHGRGVSPAGRLPVNASECEGPTEGARYAVPKPSIEWGMAPAHGLTVATLNLWGLNEPWAYMARRREVRGALPESRATTLRVPGGVWAALRRPLASRALLSCGADIVGLQESRPIPGVSDGASQATQLAQDLGCHYASLGEDTLSVSHSNGNALLSRYPVSHVERTGLPPGEGEDERFDPGLRDALHAVIEAPGGRVHCFVVHLTTRGSSAQLAEAQRLLASVAERAQDGPAIVVGDFNAKPDSPTMALLTGVTGDTPLRLRDAWSEVNPDDPGFTMPIHTPRALGDTHMRIDYVLVGPGPEVVSAALMGTEPDPDGFYASDHFGVAATLRLGG